jgi:myo-inositol 2-dehydrogenase / D-chiro-inositol 1-dehydrogenase
MLQGSSVPVRDEGAALMRIAVIGAGRMGMVHAGTLASLRDVDVLVADLDRDRARAVAEDLGVEVADDVVDAMNASDAVVIAAATDAHAGLVLRAVEARLPTFCEKPITLDIDSTAEIVANIHDAGIPFQMGFQRRFDRGFRAARDLVAGGRIGTLYVVRMAGHDPAPPHEAYIPASGGIFRDFSVHDFDSLRFVTGQEVVETYADGGVIGFPVFEKYGDVDTAVATFRLSGRAFGILSVTRHDPLGYDIRMELLGSGDSVVVGWDGRMPLRSVEPDGPAGPADPYPNFPARFAEAYRAEMEWFVELAAGRRESPCTAEDALSALRIAVACDRSRAEHRPVRVEEVG